MNNLTAIIKNIDLGAKLNEYTFDVDEKVTMWVRSNITIKARSYEEAIDIIKLNDIEKLHDLTSGKKKIPLWDSMETMKPDDSIKTDFYYKEPTIIFQTESGNKIRTNND